MSAAGPCGTPDALDASGLGSMPNVMCVPRRPLNQLDDSAALLSYILQDRSRREYEVYVCVILSDAVPTELTQGLWVLST